VVHLARANDRQLRWLYRRCLFTLYPSHYEGWGLPVAEGMALGKFCICSGAASLPEVGGALAEYHDPLDGPGCLRLVEKALLEPGWLASREERVRREYRTTSWRDCASQSFDILVSHLGLPRPVLREAA
jgi:glycosyltransferase involved in cell wall biosynthesis